MNAFKYFMKIEACEDQATVRMQHQWPGAKTTEVEARMTACVCFFFNELFQLWTMTSKLHGRPYLWMVCRVTEVALGKLQFTICLVYACVAIIAALTEWQLRVTNPFAIGHGLCTMTMSSTMCCLLRLVPWCWSYFQVVVCSRVVCRLLKGTCHMCEQCVPGSVSWEQG